MSARLDGDEPGLRKGKEVTSKLLVESFFVSSYAKNGGLEIEDLFPEELYLKAVREAYPTVSLKFTNDEAKLPRITQRLEAAFNRIGVSPFEKWPPAKVLVDWIQKSPEVVPDTTLDAFELVFKDVNNSWKK